MVGKKKKEKKRKRKISIRKKKKKELKKRRETERKGKKVDKRVVEMIADFFESHRKIVEQLYNPIFISILIVRY